MTSNLPEEIMHKIMLYNSHKTADIIRDCNISKFKRYRKDKRCWECEEIMDWIYIHQYCIKCRANGCESHHDYLLRTTGIGLERIRK